MGMALLGKGLGDEAQVNAPAGILSWTIESID
jgi:transcription elongation GreA/GreB family factor